MQAVLGGDSVGGGDVDVLFYLFFHEVLADISCGGGGLVSSPMFFLVILRFCFSFSPSC